MKCFFLHLFLTSVFTMSGLRASAQEASKNIPTVSMEKGKVEYKNFPALDTAGYVAIVESKYSCCRKEDQVVRLKAISGKGTSTTAITIVPGEDYMKELKERGLTKKEYSAELEKQIDRANQGIQARNFIPMIHVSSYQVNNDEQDQYYTVSFSLDSKSFKTDPFKITRYTMPDKCCSTESLDDLGICRYTPKVIEAWIDHTQKYLFLIIGGLETVEGCEVGPEYKILPL